MKFFSMRCKSFIVLAMVATSALAMPTTEIVVDEPAKFSITSTINEWWGSKSVQKKKSICETVTSHFFYP